MEIAVSPLSGNWVTMCWFKTDDKWESSVQFVPERNDRWCFVQLSLVLPTTRRRILKSRKLFTSPITNFPRLSPFLSRFSPKRLRNVENEVRGKWRTRLDASIWAFVPDSITCIKKDPIYKIVFVVRYCLLISIIKNRKLRRNKIRKSYFFTYTFFSKYCIVLYWWGGHFCPIHCDLFEIYCPPPNLGIGREYAD